TQTVETRFRYHWDVTLVINQGTFEPWKSGEDEEGEVVVQICWAGFFVTDSARVGLLLQNRLTSNGVIGFTPGQCFWINGERDTSGGLSRPKNRTSEQVFGREGFLAFVVVSFRITPPASISAKGGGPVLFHSVERLPTRISPAPRSVIVRTEPPLQSSETLVLQLATTCPRLPSQKRSRYPTIGTIPGQRSASSDFWRNGRTSRPR